MSFMYTEYTERILSNPIDWDTADIGVGAYLESGASPPDSVANRDAAVIDAFSDEIAEGPEILANITVNRDDAGNLTFIDADDTIFGAVSAQGNIKGFVIFDYTGGTIGGAGNRPLFWIDNAGSSFAQATNGSDITVAWAATGVFDIASTT